MQVFTWNSNVVDRWSMLWKDPIVRGGAWDCIFLQEVGKPPSAWGAPVAGSAWGAASDESAVIRVYSVTGDGLATRFVTHCEWPNRRKNHLAVVTKSAPRWYADLGGDMGERPVLGLKLRLRWKDAAADVLAGCIHVIASESKAPSEIREIVQRVEAMRQHVRCVGWILVGDFNCEGARAAAAARCVGSQPGFPTHGTRNFPIDYLLASRSELLAAFADMWQPGTAQSDHRSAYYDQLGGPAVDVL